MRGQDRARQALYGAVQGAPEGRLLVQLLPGREPSRRRGPDRADVSAGLPALRARARGVEGAAAAPWLIRIAHNLAANLYRDRARKPQTALDSVAEPEGLHSTEDLVEGREELRHILEGVQQLPDDRREALIMRFALGMDNKEIARALGRTDGATKVLIHRAIRQLEEIIREPQEV